MIEIIPNTHPIFVHYTVALIPVSAFCYFLGYIFCKQGVGKELSVVGRWCLWFGAFVTIATVSAGFIAYYSVAHDTASHIAMTIHRNWAIATLVAIVLSAILSIILHFKNKSVGRGFLLMMSFTAMLVTVTAWFGAEVVYRYGIGVQTLPVSTGVGHQHSPVDAISDSKSFLQKKHGYGEHEH